MPPSHGVRICRACGAVIAVIVVPGLQTASTCGDCTPRT
jgi:hypothetical protein